MVYHKAVKCPRCERSDFILGLGYPTADRIDFQEVVSCSMCNWMQPVPTFRVFEQVCAIEAEKE